MNQSATATLSPKYLAQEVPQPRKFLQMGRLVLGLAFIGLVFLFLYGVASLSQRISTIGHSEDTRPLTISIADQLIGVPANMVRFSHQRQSQTLDRLDLYALWPRLEGYSHLNRAYFNRPDINKQLIYITLEPRDISRAMTDRLDPIYRKIIVEPGAKGPAGLTIYGFDQEAGFASEVLIVSPEATDGTQFVARCLVGEAADISLAPCERDIFVSEKLTLTYRFPKQMLSQWQTLEAKIKNLTSAIVR